MKKFVLISFWVLLAQFSFAGGLLTNYNQSAQYVRMMSRNASFDIDAVFYNPAGLVYLENGFHISLSSQTIWQDKIINTEFPLLNNKKYVGEVFVPVFPDIYAVYKMDKWAFSFGFNPVGGGGSANYDKGLPSFEIPLSKLPGGLKDLTKIDPSLKVDGYNVDLAFDGSSVYFGFQLGATYKINDMFSVFGGVRYLNAQNTYNGNIKNIQLKTGGKMIGAKDWMNGVANKISGLSAQASAGAEKLGQTANQMQPIIDANAGGYTLAQLQGAGHLSAEGKGQLEGALKQIGLKDEQINAMKASEIQQLFVTTQGKLTQQATLLTQTAGGLNDNASKLNDKEVDAKQTGHGFTPIIGVNITPVEGLRIALRYEMLTKLNLTNNTKKDDLGLFPDKAKVTSDVPAILAFGLGYENQKFETQLSFNYYFDKGVKNWGYNTRDLSVYGKNSPNVRKKEIDHNLYEVALGFQYNITDNFAVSIGGLHGKTGVADSFQDDLSNSKTSTSIGGGIEWKINDRLILDVGALNSFYDNEKVTFNDPNVGKYNESYTSTTFDVIVGLSYSIFK